MTMPVKGADLVSEEILMRRKVLIRQPMMLYIGRMFEYINSLDSVLIMCFF